MDNSVSSRKLEVKHAGAAIEYGTLTLLMESCFQQPVLVMPLEPLSRPMDWRLMQVFGEIGKIHHLA